MPLASSNVNNLTCESHPKNTQYADLYLCKVFIVYIFCIQSTWESCLKKSDFLEVKNEKIIVDTYRLYESRKGLHSIKNNLVRFFIVRF